MARKNTTVLLQKLREFMANSTIVNAKIQAYIIPTEDAHMSEYIAECDARRAFITGFTGSAGTAVVTETKAAIWTDGRYHLQAMQQIDDNWILMKAGLPDIPTKTEWLVKELPKNSRVGVDPMLISQDQWVSLSTELDEGGLKLVAVEKNLINLIWEKRPERPTSSLFNQSLENAGLSWQKKVDLVRKEMERKGAKFLIAGELDEIAWLLNLRGSDIEYNPVFFSYLLIAMDMIYFFIDDRQIKPTILEHLRNGLEDSESRDAFNVIIKPYDSFIEVLRTVVDENLTNGSKFWVSEKLNHATYDVIPKAVRFKGFSPIARLKAVKNDAELRAMKNCHIEDAVALCQFFSWLEKEVPKRNVTELDAAHYALQCREKRANYVSLSFETISATGPNGAIIHYNPTVESNRVISPNELFLFDSGAQYRDGTTDITRTIHFGQPTDYEKECFTRVLKGHIAIDRAVFPNNTKGIFLDSFARQHLWNAGLSYMHGTGHGVGSFLNVHEGPYGIGNRRNKDEMDLKKNMVLSNEPGYYEDSKFGIRIENLFTIVDANTKYNYKNLGYLTCEMISLVPIQIKMIDTLLMTNDELHWLNNYHKKCRETVGPKLLAYNMQEAHNWLLRETQPINITP